MAKRKRKSQYDSTMYYEGREVGKGTNSDGDAYTTLIGVCNGDAARVLREYTYFSPELRAALEKTAEMQESEGEDKMFDKSQKEFKTAFGPDEKIEVIDLNFKGSRGYVSSIIIDRNGIMYEVILTSIAHQSKNVLRPEAIKYPACMLKSLEVSE